jgi:hypothetical protein
VFGNSSTSFFITPFIRLKRAFSVSDMPESDEAGTLSWDFSASILLPHWGLKRQPIVHPGTDCIPKFIFVNTQKRIFSIFFKNYRDASFPPRFPRIQGFRTAGGEFWIDGLIGSDITNGIRQSVKAIR